MVPNVTNSKHVFVLEEDFHDWISSEFVQCRNFFLLWFMIPNCLVFLDIIAIQMDALLQPVIIDRVFEFLQVLDIDRCQYVCQAWRESALRKLNKCPQIDSYEFFAVETCWDYDYFGKYWELVMILKRTVVDD